MVTIEQRTMKKVFMRLLPFLIFCYFISFLDRVNVGFAALQMNKDLGLTASEPVWKLSFGSEGEVAGRSIKLDASRLR